VNAVLQIRGLTHAFGGLTAVNNLDLEVREGEILSLIGPNGSGKTTTLNLVSGVIRPQLGSVKVGERELAGLRADQVAGMGVMRTFQNIRLFTQMSVLDNILVGSHTKARVGPIAAVLRTPGAMAKERGARRRALEVMALFGERLLPRQNHPVVSLSYANRRRTEICRALLGEPRLLLLDEPAAGMNPHETLELTEQIRAIRDRGVSILLVEHHMQMVMRVSDRIAVMDHGVKIAEGLAAEVAADRNVIEAYLGRRAVSR